MAKTKNRVRSRFVQVRGQDSIWCSYHKQLEPRSSFKVTSSGKVQGYCAEGMREYVARRADKIDPDRINRRIERIHTKEEKARQLQRKKDLRELQMAVRSELRANGQLQKELTKLSRRYNGFIRRMEWIALDSLPEDDPRVKERESKPRRAKVKKRRCPFEPYTQGMIKEHFGENCYLCGAKTKRGFRQVEHVIPLSRNGADILGNVRFACPECNQRKAALLVSELQQMYKNWPIESAVYVEEEAQDACEKAWKRWRQNGAC